MKNYKKILESYITKLQNGEELNNKETEKLLEIMMNTIEKTINSSNIGQKLIVSLKYCDGDMNEFLRYYENLDKDIKYVCSIDDEYAKLIIQILPRLELIETILQTKKIKENPIDIKKVGILLEELGQKLKEYEGDE